MPRDEARARGNGHDQRRAFDPVRGRLGQAKKVNDPLAKYGLKRGENGLHVIMMCEVPSNPILAPICTAAHHS